MVSDETASVIDISALELEVKQAYDKNRLRECMRLLKTLLSVHPDSETAKTVESAIASDLDQILNEVRALMEERQSGSEQGRLSAAEVMLSKVLDIDPDHKGARTLLQAVKALGQRLEHVQQSNPAKTDIPFTVSAGPAPKNTKKSSTARMPVLLVAVGLAAGGFVFAKQMHFRKPQATPYTPVPAPNVQKHNEPPVAASPILAATSVTPVNGAVQPVNSPPPVIPGSEVPHPPAVSSKPAASVVVTARPVPVAPAQFGQLAVSSPVATDIYDGEEYLGATPLTLQLPAGNHTLEYRHANLRKSVTHVVRPDETSTALVTFDVVVQINAKPWADVFLDGSERQALGQTPLSDVRVPIGRVLVFQNPKFPAKSYRITGKETAIQITFP
jgi:hypothetical protein